MPRVHWLLYGGIITLWMIFGWLVWLKTPAHAHGWYPPECCHDMDCAPVTQAAHVAGALMGNSLVATPPLLMVTTRHGYVVVPHNFPIKQSKDGQMHACMRRDAVGAMVLICLFMPPSL